MMMFQSSSRAKRCVARLITALLALAVAILVALPASAGTLHTTDDAGVLSASQVSALRGRVTGYDFDVRLITTTSYASKSDLGNYVHRFVTEPNIVVIGLDTEHRHVSVHFGTGTRIADSEFKAVEAAGISYFKDANWTGGVTAILDRAEKAVGTKTSSAVGRRRSPPEALHLPRELAYWGSFSGSWSSAASSVCFVGSSRAGRTYPATA